VVLLFKALEVSLSTVVAKAILRLLQRPVFPLGYFDGGSKVFHSECGFLQKNSLLVDPAAGCLINTSILQTLGSTTSIVLNSGLLTSEEATPSPFRSSFSELHHVANPSGIFPPVTR
jgi:hypothetical protein